MVAVGITSTFVAESKSKSLRSEWDFKWNDNKLLVPASSHAEDTLVKNGSTWNEDEPIKKEKTPFQTCALCWNFCVTLYCVTIFFYFLNAFHNHINLFDFDIN